MRRKLWNMAGRDRRLFNQIEGDAYSRQREFLLTEGTYEINPYPQTLEVWGDFACFSRPEMKVEKMKAKVWIWRR